MDFNFIAAVIFTTGERLLFDAAEVVSVLETRDGKLEGCTDRRTVYYNTAVITTKQGNNYRVFDGEDKCRHVAKNIEAARRMMNGQWHRPTVSV